MAMLLLFSCKSRTASTVTQSDSAASKATLVKETEDLRKRFMPMIEGVWVKKVYINSIVKTRSPYQSQAKLNDVASIIVKLNNLKKDSIMAGYSLNNHEGGDFTVFFKLGLKPTSLKTNLPDYENQINFYELGYSTKGADTSLILYHCNKRNKIIDSVIYTRVVRSTSSTDAGYGIDYITNKKLFTGKYELIDINGHKSTVNFTDDGKISGFLSFAKYDVNTDFVAGPGNNIDDIIFDLYTNVSADFAYRFDADTLKLFKIDYNADSTLLNFGDLRYKLIKQK
ncbi:hypothetical protein BDD43_1812 [Mucilaginibacter gracilis]|uniref:Uncharacterized protein n=2 Tax=Mucilaginibacter gracilis TaxID=423350 RepID=A0A495IYL9_9SPHI|nr:hypothetical protein BDD43_1812 [Mucilaginibacter gracilis]